MQAFETEALVDSEGRIKVDAPAPPNIEPGRHRVLLLAGKPALTPARAKLRLPG